MTDIAIATGFGTLAQSIRVKNGKRIYDQAEALGLTPSYITQIETGQIGPDVKYVESFSKWLNLDLQDQLALIKSLRKANIVDLEAERKRRKGPELKLFRRVHSMSPVEIRAIATEGGSDE